MTSLLTSSFFIFSLYNLAFGSGNRFFLDRLGSRIIDGEKAENGQFPYQVSMRYRNSNICGGSIITERWILTAAHCIGSKKPDQMTIVVGTNDLLSGGQRYQPIKMILHPEFNPLVLRNDIGLIKVDQNIEYNEFVQPVPLPTSDFDKANYPAVVSGWGRDADGRIPRYLQYLSTCIVNHTECKDWSEQFINDRHICTFSRFGQGPCSGDSGNPLVSDGIQVGIGSFVLVNCAYGYPDVYTRVWSHMGWIHEKITEEN